ncbi:single stranded nucleic acid binding protein [Thoreauomyces humboldtii]|nr:single stranded nucleic acid binding protein [Thoreauomyces humboldtii]
MSDEQAHAADHKDESGTGEDEVAPSVDQHFEPVMKLEQLDEIKTGEEDDEALFKMRSKLFRFEKSTNEWKERGTGDIKLLKHKDTTKIRILMRREKTHKICANHSITQAMELQPNVGSDRSWVWSTLADVSDGEPTQELLAIRFANAENANKFKDAFLDAQKHNATLEGSEPAKETTGASEAEDSESETESEKAEAKEDAKETKEEEAKEEETKEETKE